MAISRWLDQQRFQAERLLQINSETLPGDRICSLLIPAPLRAKLKAHLIATGESPGIYLRELLKRNRSRLLKENWHGNLSLFRRYQSQGLELCRLNFRAMPVVWCELGVFADFLGVSRCYLFVRLIEIDLFDCPEENVRVPTFRLEEYDQYFPQQIETTIRIIRGTIVERGIKQEPKEELNLPLRFFPFPYPNELLQAWLTRNYWR